ncbi:phosphoribosylformylglycinamidine synthase subunit PurQ [Nitrososphaera sp.]|uniref:phosphoribosylformylglycinamidine synthase subunit PurQ n=1 Tax=Nitrososphaera sp. TaxID=1971748 RepID=UPI002EDAFA93
MKIGIAVFPGSNCDRDVHHVLNNVVGVQADFIWHTKDRILGYDAMVIPGGFAFGDRLRAGIIAAHSPIVQEVKRLAKEGTPVLGICNGFQILVESGLLPGALLMNHSLRFVCRWTKVKVQNNSTPFTRSFSKRQEFDIPVAHGEGRYVATPDIVKELKKKNQVVLQYSHDDPNGSTELIAAICNEQGNVMGMMPHPERASESIVSARGSGEAIAIFRSLASFLEQKAVA